MGVPDICSLTLTSLLWDDVLFPHIFPYLSLKDLFTLRGLSKDYKKLIDGYFSQMKICDLSEYSKTFSEVAFWVLIQNCKQLRGFIAKDCFWLTNELVKSIVLKNENITSIDLSHCCNLTSPALQPVIINLKNLTSLKLKQCLWLTTGCLEALALHQYKIEKLSLKKCYNIGDVQAINVLLKRLQNLKVLNLSGIQCISDSTMEVIAHSNTKLRTLNINGCRQVTSYGVTMVSEYCKDLSYFYISECSITFDTLQQLKKKVRYLYFKQDPVRLRCGIEGFELLRHLPV